ncbi:MAG: hypothetical protein ACYCSW_05330 [bacterium]
MSESSAIKFLNYAELIKNLNKFDIIEYTINKEKEYVILVKGSNFDNENKYKGSQLTISLFDKHYSLSYIEMILRRFNINYEDFWNN